MVFARTVTKKNVCLIVIFFILFLAGGALLLWSRSKKEPVTLVYTLLCEADAEVADSLSLGDTLIDACGKEAAGEILKITVENALREDGFGVYSLPDRRTVCLTLLGEGVQDGENARIGTLMPMVGERVFLSGGTLLEGICLRVRVL